ncbi:hypothetical protein Phum_PHUM368310 [Pediculus humanus corporis]|uniref:Uncharacterized protein n=1 Tax=Pediculus humanus subsp. corporis TaxID=121224 RepID=E0VPX5_PEDHC|nr:uncharacterized protein Phum_PHUM368310 [Pediculus humanus corporis]EEB15431.1 hypothetical protein Phum_PHUM368310 [Pediculus humanus corporis]
MRTAGAPSGAKSPGNTSTSGITGSPGVSMPAEAKTPPTLQNKQMQKDHPSVSKRLRRRKILEKMKIMRQCES